MKNKIASTCFIATAYFLFSACNSSSEKTNKQSTGTPSLEVEQTQIPTVKEVDRSLEEIQAEEKAAGNICTIAQEKN